MYSINSGYNDSCNCHPEYHEITDDCETLQRLADVVACEECKWWSPDRNDFYVRRDFTDQEWDDFCRELIDARFRREQKLAQEKKEREALQSKVRLLDKLSHARVSLEIYRKELTPEAVSAREDAIKQIQKEIDKL